MTKKKNKQSQDKAEEKQEVESSEEQPPSQAEDLQPLVDKLNDDLKRAQADFVNLKRRSQQEQASRIAFIKADVVRSVLPVVDSLERAVAHQPAELADSDWVKGVDVICKQLHKVLSDYGVNKIEAVGTEFDPNLHEAVAMDNSEGETEIVVEEMQTGYKLNETVIRHAMVKVGRE
jgi:molecular chaperone GrpE